MADALLPEPAGSDNGSTLFPEEKGTQHVSEEYRAALKGASSLCSGTRKQDASPLQGSECHGQLEGDEVQNQRQRVDAQHGSHHHMNQRQHQQQLSEKYVAYLGCIKDNWSSCHAAKLLTEDLIEYLRPRFVLLSTPLKVRVLTSLLYIKPELVGDVPVP